MSGPHRPGLQGELLRQCSKRLTSPFLWLKKFKNFRQAGPGISLRVRSNVKPAMLGVPKGLDSNQIS